MAPKSNCIVHREAERLPSKEKNKLRKPVVEKMRRDRINSSIELLKVLLESEFQQHQSNSKLEKADILEVAVSYLKGQSQQEGHEFGHKSPELDFNTGYLRCLREALYFLSLGDPKRETQTQLIKHFCKVHVIADVVCPAAALCPPPASSSCPMPKKQWASKNPVGVSPTLWRPW